jgi:segregation and condensation protein A
MSETSTKNYKVRTGSFEGPLDLLLSLIEQRKLFINEISLSEVTNDYITFIKNHEYFDSENKIADTSSFVLIAATLILIKSKSLLPNLALTEEEEDKISDLEARLALYQIIKKSSIDIKENFGLKVIFSPIRDRNNMVVFSPDSKMTVSVMEECARDVIGNLPKKIIPLPEIEVKRVINIDQMINNLTDRIQNAISMSFSSFSKSHGGESHRETKLNVIVSFLAMLELVREGIIEAMQNSEFEDITMEKTNSNQNG